MARYEELLYIKPAGEATRNENGDFVPGNEADWTFLSECRDEPSDSGREVAVTDGDAREFTSIVQLPEDCPEIGTGVRVQVRDITGAVVMEGTAKRFKKYRKSCRLWV